ncbi:MAG: mechanosensitive ion channel, partial [Nitrospirae bacterium]|nr:mechanosensitive ion channel [Nitrospirota bacterium]
LVRALSLRMSARLGDKNGRQATFTAVLSLLRGGLPVLAVWISIYLFRIPESVKVVIDRFFLAILTLLIIYLLARAVDAMVAILNVRAAKTPSPLDDQLVPLGGKVIKGFIWGIGLLLFLQNVLDYNISSLIAGLGVGGVAVAFAAQDMIANIFGAVMIFVDRPFKVGDAVSLEGYEGAIETIGLRSTRVRTWDGTLVVIPNKTVAAANITNLAVRPTRRTNFTIGLVYGTSTEKLERALAILRDVMAKHPSTAESRAYFNRFGDFSLNILVQHWCNEMNYEIYLRSMEEMNLAIKRQFEEEGIEFAFPTQTIEMKTIQKTK